MLKKTLINLKMLSNKKNFCTLKVNQFFFPICRGMSTKQAKNRNIPNRQNKKKKIEREIYANSNVLCQNVDQQKKKEKYGIYANCIYYVD